MTLSRPFSDVCGRAVHKWHIFTGDSNHRSANTFYKWYRVKNSKDGGICTFCLQISIFFSIMFGCFQNPRSLLFRQVCIHVVSYWSCKFLKLCPKNVPFVRDLLRFLTHWFTLIR
jgi:hypothetical protein